MSANIDKLRELAMGATGGAWRTESYYDMDGVRRTILIPFSLELPPGMEESDMTYIAAANPDTVLSLLDELDAENTSRRAAQARVAELTEQVQKLGRELHRHKLDTARLDWLADRENNIGNVQLPTECVQAHPESLRAAIDMAMEEAA